MAGFLGVSLPTVVNWINAGRLQAHRTPGGHRRIARADLVAFGRDAGMPLPPEVLDPAPDRRKRVLIIDDDPDFSEVVRDFLRVNTALDVRVANTAFDAGLVMGRFVPDLVLVDLTMPDLDAEEMRDRLRADDALSAVSVVACSPIPDDANRRQRLVQVFDGLLEKPLSLDTLVRVIQRRLGQGPDTPE